MATSRQMSDLVKTSSSFAVFFSCFAYARRGCEEAELAERMEFRKERSAARP